MATVTKSFCMDTERDADLLAWCEKHPARAFSPAVRGKLRTAIQQERVSLADVLQEVREVKRLLRSGGVIVGTAGGADQEPTDPEEAAVLRKLGGLGV